MVFGAKRPTVPLQETPFEILGKIAADPGFAEQSAPGVGLSLRDQGFREALLAEAGQRREAGEPGARSPVRICLWHQFLGAPDERRAIRPVRVGLQERPDFGERYVGVRAPEPAPVNHGRGKRMPGPFRAPGSPVPLAA